MVKGVAIVLLDEATLSRPHRAAEICQQNKKREREREAACKVNRLIGNDVINMHYLGICSHLFIYFDV